MRALYYFFLFVGSIVLLISTFSFVLPIHPNQLAIIHTLARWILYGFVLEYLVGLLLAANKVYYAKKEWISLVAILISVSLESLAGFLGVVKLAKLAKLLKAMKGLKAYKSLKVVKFIKTIKLGKKTRKAM
ncbi:hypothetical protein [Desulfuribacillus alkaliarsenatis]|uniref:Uncharacterized protein n=1 Tax=Desulfuribacillus alkaliarsenatis TaxID=766136 RepID=A0A1E5G2I2_9FIRM|nr:hypothetical protein [Desulfuribacillus alkaliarsenatis]OEF97093.1 hypothetical protein BHF68_05705 [Desulfuribacillus alkaliarsenatis]